MKVPKTTVEDFKDWAVRNDINLTKYPLVTDTVLELALNFANTKSQKLEDDKEVNRERNKLRAAKPKSEHTEEIKSNGV